MCYKTSYLIDNRRHIQNALNTLIYLFDDILNLFCRCMSILKRGSVLKRVLSSYSNGSPVTISVLGGATIHSYIFIQHGNCGFEPWVNHHLRLVYLCSVTTHGSNFVAQSKQKLSQEVHYCMEPFNRFLTEVEITLV